MNPLASTRCASRLLMALAAISGIIFAVACSSSSGTGIPNNNGFTNSNFSGTYVVTISGTDINANAETESFFTIVGTIEADGNGNIKGGTTTVDINDPDLGGVFLGQPVSASTYSVLQDGRGTGTLITPQKTFSIDFVLTSNSHGLITRFDDSGTGSGTLDIQGTATQSALTSLAFSVTGADSSGIDLLGNVGAFTLNSSGIITPAGVTDFNDDGDSSLSGSTGLVLTGSVVLTSSTFGTAEFDSDFGDLLFDVWVIDSSHLKLIETDDSGLALSGDAFTQATAFTPGQLVFTLAGQDNEFPPEPVAVGGFVTTDVNGNLSNGIEDINDAGSVGTVPTFSGACATFTAGRCQWATSAFTNGITSNLGFAAYPYSSDGSNGVLMLQDDNNGLLQGSAFAQSATSFTAAGYGLNLSGANSDGEGDVGEVDDIAQFNSTSAASPATNMTGVLDENSILNGPVPDSSLSGTYTPDSPATGRGSISVTTPRTFIGGLTLQYYTVDANTVLFIEVDSEQLSAGMFETQSSPTGGVRSRAIVLPTVRAHSAHKGRAAWHHK